jgi:hypothetical protein
MIVGQPLKRHHKTRSNQIGNGAFGLAVSADGEDLVEFWMNAYEVILGRFLHLDPRNSFTRVARPARMFPVTRERWAQIGITAQFLIVVRTLGEFFRLRHVLGTSFSDAVAAPYESHGGQLCLLKSCYRLQAC